AAGMRRGLAESAGLRAHPAVLPGAGARPGVRHVRGRRGDVHRDRPAAGRVVDPTGRGGARLAAGVPGEPSARRGRTALRLPDPPGPPGRGAVAVPGPGGGVAARERAVLQPAAAHPARPGCWPGSVAARRSAVPARRFHRLGTLVRQPGPDTTGELAAAED